MWRYFAQISTSCQILKMAGPGPEKGWANVKTIFHFDAPPPENGYPRQKRSFLTPPRRHWYPSPTSRDLRRPPRGTRWRGIVLPDVPWGWPQPPPWPSSRDVLGTLGTLRTWKRGSKIFFGIAVAGPMSKAKPRECRNATPKEGDCSKE